MKKSSPTRNANGFAQCVVMTEGALRRSGNWNGSGCSRFLQRRTALATFSRAGGRSSEDSTVPANVAICNLRQRSSSKRVTATQERTIVEERSDDEVKKRCRCTKQLKQNKQQSPHRNGWIDLAAAANAACRSNQQQQQQPQLTSQPSSSMQHRSGADSKTLVALVHNRRPSTSRLLHTAHCTSTLKSFPSFHPPTLFHTPYSRLKHIAIDCRRTRCIFAPAARPGGSGTTCLGSERRDGDGEWVLLGMGKVPLFGSNLADKAYLPLS